MCGICGVVHASPARPVHERDLVSMRDTLRHRGPDDAGVHLGPGAGLGVRRLAILDLSPRGHMPMHTPDGRYHIVYNGEVYNSPTLRAELRGRGVSFRSRTDTEVLLHLFAREGPAMLGRLNGMFAVAVWDAAERTLFLARDRLGIKPLFYAETEDGSLRFASEPKALFAAGVPAEMDQETWEELLCFRYVAGERTPFRAVRRLLPGHFLTWRDGRVRIRKWWDLASRARALRSDPPADPVRWYRETLDDAVRLRRLSDVPIGVLLSGGLDSGSVAASLARQARERIASFTVTFAQPDYDEAPLAGLVARRWGLSEHRRRLGDDELYDRLLQACWLNDEPLAHFNEPHLWTISEFARPLVTVLLSGEGADETLGGYLRYRPLQFPRALGLLSATRAATSRFAPPRLRKLGRMLEDAGADGPLLFGACDVLPGDLRALGMEPRESYPYRERVLARARALYEAPGDAARRAMFSDQHTFLCSILDRNDRMTMGASIECRVPFLDHRLVEGLAALSTRHVLSRRRSKRLLRDAVGDRLPRAVLRGRKWGFGTPWDSYLRQVPELHALLGDLHRLPPICDGPLESGRVRRLVERYLAGDPGGSALVRQLAVIALWHRACSGSGSAAAREAVHRDALRGDGGPEPSRGALAV